MSTGKNASSKPKVRAQKKKKRPVTVEKGMGVAGSPVCELESQLSDFFRKQDDQDPIFRADQQFLLSLCPGLYSLDEGTKFCVKAKMLDLLAEALHPTQSQGPPPPFGSMDLYPQPVQPMGRTQNFMPQQFMQPQPIQQPTPSVQPNQPIQPAQKFNYADKMWDREIPFNQH